jgi:hypothetical protein
MIIALQSTSRSSSVTESGRVPGGPPHGAPIPGQGTTHGSA